MRADGFLNWLDGMCPDCNTAVAAPSGPLACETCWRVVPMSVRRRDGTLSPTGRWMRLPAGLHDAAEVVIALRAAVWVAERGPNPASRGA